MLSQISSRSGSLRQLSGLLTSTSSTLYSTAGSESSACLSVCQRAFSTVTSLFSSAAPRQSVAALQTPPQDPWTPTKDLRKRKCLTKRMGHMLSVLESELEQDAIKERKLPSFGPGDILHIRMAVPENKRRAAIIKGTCIAMENRGWRTSFTIRNHITQAGAFERTFPLYSPNILEITVMGNRPVRRAKLYYLRKRTPKEYRVQ